MELSLATSAANAGSAVAAVCFSGFCAMSRGAVAAQNIDENKDRPQVEN